MKKLFYLIIALFFLLPHDSFAQKYKDAEGKIRVSLVKNPFKGDRAGDPMSNSPDRLEKSGLKKILTDMWVDIKVVQTVRLTEEEEKQYGVRNRFGFANGHLAEFAAQNERNNIFNIGLYNNCSSLMGMLGGLQHSGQGTELKKVGLIFIDAHGDFNTPETTLSGMLGGMPVAVAAGHCLQRLRVQSGLDPAIPIENIVLAGVRDTDPLEQERIEQYKVAQISVDDIRKLSDNIHEQMRRLSQTTDLIYIHIDMDVLDPKEVSGHPLTVPNGPTSKELAAAMRLMFAYEKAAAIGIASVPEEDKGNLSLNAAYALIQGAIAGIKDR